MMTGFGSLDIYSDIFMVDKHRCVIPLHIDLHDFGCIRACIKRVCLYLQKGIIYDKKSLMV